MRKFSLKFSTMRILPSTVIILLSISYCQSAYYTDNVWDIMKYRAVTKPFRLENYYRELRRQVPDFTKKPPESRHQKERAHVKKNICKNILMSPYFRDRSEIWLNTDLDKVRTKLRMEHKTIFALLYKKSDKSHFLGLGSTYEYDNPYQLIPTAYLDHNGLPRDENVILCLAQDTQNDSIKEYYVSREYNVNTVEDAYPILGRLIFTMAQGNLLVIKALAEESAISAEFFRRSRLLEGFYIVKRRKFKATKTAAQDPICSLSDSDKTRLCASVFGATLFEKNGVVFSPRDDANDFECRKRLVRIHLPVFAPFVRVFGTTFLNPHREYSEWVVGCKASPNKGEPILFHISRGPHHNTVFTFTDTRDGQQISIYGYFNNVSVVGEVSPEADHQHQPSTEEDQMTEVNLLTD